MLIKQKSPLLPRNVALVTSGELLIVFSTRVNLLYFLYSTAQKCYLLHLIKQNCLLKIYSNLYDSGISLPAFPARTNLKLYNISVSPKMVRKNVMNLDLSKASGPDCIPVVVLENCERELSYLAELFNKCLKESSFPNCWKVSSVVPVFKNVGESSATNNYRPVSLLSVLSKVFEKLVNNRIADHLEKCGLFSDFQYGFRSSRSTADLLTVVSDRTARAFNRSGTTRAVALDISKASDRVWHAGLLHILKSYGISGQIFGLISSFLSNRRLRVVLDGKSSQEYPVNAGIRQGFILGLTLFLLYINDLPEDVICDIAIYADDTILSILSVTGHLICGNNLNWLLDLNLIYETL